MDARADVYSLGVMTYEALTGDLPFGIGSLIDIGIKQAGGAGSIDTRGMRPNVARAVLRALALNRDERPTGPPKFAAGLKEQ